MGWLGDKLTGGLDDYEDAEDKYKDKVAENTGSAGFEKAQRQGQLGATSVGANTGESAKAAASSAGATKGAASALGESVQGEATQNAVASETEKAAQKNQEEVTAAEDELKEAAADMEKKQGTFEKIGDINNKIGTGALTALGTAVGGPVGGAIGSGAGAAVGAGREFLNAKARDTDNKWGRGALNLASLITSDERAKVIQERCGYKPRVKKEALLHLLDDLKEKVNE